MNRKFYILLPMTALWIFCVGFGMLSIFRYDNTPGAKLESSATWPSESQITRSSAYQLLLFAHPRCPCTIASLEELKVITQQAPSLSTLVVFMMPEEPDSSWFNTEHWQKAKSISNGAIFADLGGKEAKIFGVQTSGHALLYDLQGNLLFSGGITLSRGHLGNNAGRESVLAYLSKAKNRCSLESTPVFGCSLINE